MKCAVHPDADAVGYCRNCGKALCAVCVRPVRDVLYCEDCLARVMGIPPATQPGAASPLPPAIPATGVAAAPVASGLVPSPLLAFFLGFLPGLGPFYNDQFGKVLIHLALFLFLSTTSIPRAPPAPPAPPLRISPPPPCRSIL